MQKAQLLTIMNMIHHYWFKGYIRNDELFRFIDELITKEQNPFENLKLMRMLVRNCIYQIKALQYGYNSNEILSSQVFDKNFIDKLYAEVYCHLKSLIGQEKTDKCPGCGKQINSIVKIIEKSDLIRDFEFYQEYIGRVCWFRYCACKWMDSMVCEVD